MPFAARRHESRQVLLQVPARSEEYRHHAQGAHAFAMELRGAGRQRRLHRFEKGEHDALAGQQFPQLGYELLERARPLRVARAVSEEDDRLSCHASIIAEAR